VSLRSRRDPARLGPDVTAHGIYKSKDPEIAVEMDADAGSADEAASPMQQVVQSNWTGELDIYDIMELKFANDKMRCYQPVHNWIGG
jgi:hypothetical protein